MNDIERFGEGGNIEIRSDDGKSVITGYAATFDTPSHDLGGFREVVRPGAFDRSLREKVDVIARANHRSEGLLGRVSSGTLRLSVDARGLRYEIDVPDTTAGRDTLEYIKRGDIRESSFAFRTPKAGDKWEARSSDGLMLRALVDLDLVDVAPVIDKAAFPATQVSARTLEAARATAEPPPPPPGVPAEVNEARLRMSEK
jgi:hypothetical protein